MDTIAQLDHVQSVYPFFEGYCDEATANGKTVIDELVIQPYAPDRQIANQCHMTSGEAGRSIFPVMPVSSSKWTG